MLAQFTKRIGILKRTSLLILKGPATSDPDDDTVLEEVEEIKKKKKVEGVDGIDDIVDSNTNGVRGERSEVGVGLNLGLVFIGK